MFEEISRIIKDLPEEDQKSFLEKAKLQAQSAAKTAVERKRKEEEKESFKATGKWTTEDENFKAEAEISEEDRKNITFILKDQENNETKFSLSKKEFFNFFKMLEEVNSFTKEQEEAYEDPWTKYVKDIADRISNSAVLLSCPRRKSRIFHIR